MAAITGHLERGYTTEFERADDGTFGVKSDTRDEAVAHTALTRTHMVRSAAEFFLTSNQIRFRHEWDGKQLVIRIVESPFRKADGTPTVPQDSVPWAKGGSDVSQVKVWSLDNSKMDCPVFDLPAGATRVGGTCPGANEAQSIVKARHGVVPAPPRGGAAMPYTPPELRYSGFGDEGQQVVDLPNTICASCYAEGGSFAYADNQIRMIIRHWWVRAMMREARDEFIDLMSESLLMLPYPLGAKDPVDGGPIYPVRLHSSGDFFDKVYAQAWLEIADRLYDHPEGNRIRFWAPTRTWAAGWGDWWAETLPRHSPHFVVRPSAYHFNDPAPGALAEGAAQGSTSVYATEVDKQRARTTFWAAQTPSLTLKDGSVVSEADLYDWQCPAYAVQPSTTKAGKLVDAAKSCSHAVNPGGEHHCRACWTRPDLRINYCAH